MIQKLSDCSPHAKCLANAPLAIALCYRTEGLISPSVSRHRSQRGDGKSAFTGRRNWPGHCLAWHCAAAGTDAGGPGRHCSCPAAWRRLHLWPAATRRLKNSGRSKTGMNLSAFTGSTIRIKGIRAAQTGLSVPLFSRFQPPKYAFLMASDCASSAPVPLRTTLPDSRTLGPVGKLKGHLCILLYQQNGSARGVEFPDDVEQICSTKMGAKPMEGSSSINSLGWLMRARPMASICCSPPERVPAIWWRRSLRRGNRVKISSRSCLVARLWM